jgi:hypothetical protein
VAKLSGCRHDLSDALIAAFRRVGRIRRAVQASRTVSEPSIVVSSSESDPAALSLGDLVSASQAAIAAVRAWQSGRYAATVCEHASD